MSSDFDDLDRALASGLSSLAPDVGSGDEALASMRPVFVRARNRRRVARAGASMAVLFVIGTVAVLSAPGSTRSHVNVSSPPTAPVDTRPPVKRTPTSLPGKTVPSTTSTTVPESSTVAPAPGTGHSGNTNPTTPPTSPETVPNTAPGGGPGPSGGGNDHGGSSTTTTFTGQDGIRTYTSPGGRIRVRFARGVLTLVQVDPANGFSSEVKDNGPDRVDVRFVNDQAEYRIVVDIEHGQPVQTAHHGPGSD